MEFSRPRHGSTWPAAHARGVLRIPRKPRYFSRQLEKPLGRTSMDRRRFVIGTAASALAAGSAFAQETFPSHAITIFNAFPPGGINDIVTRPFASTLEPLLKQPVVVETKAGAGGQVGAQVAAVAKPLVVVTNEQQPYKTLKDFIDDAKKRPEQIVYSSGGLYGATHQPVALL